jgi:hypothetical protein
METNAAAHSSTHSVPLFVLPATTPKQRRIPSWRLLDLSTRQELLALLTQMIGHHVPGSRVSDERVVPDESH